MTQPQTNSSNSTKTPAEAGRRGGVLDAGIDPVTGLHRMSRTAGAGTQEYVAINNIAVAAIIFGVASALALLDWTMVFVAVAGVILSIVALKQIRASNGTQTGSILAAGGLILALGFCGFRVASDVIDTRRTAADRAEIVRIVNEFSDLVKGEKFDLAYALFSDRFHERVTRTQFDQLWKLMHTSEVYGKGTMVLNGNFGWENDKDTGVRKGTSVLVVTPERSAVADRQPAYFRKVGGAWKIDDIPTWFPPPKPAAPQGGMPPAPSVDPGPPSKLGPNLDPMPPSK